MIDFPSRETVEQLRKQFPRGARVELIRMEDPFTELKPGDRGTVVFVDDAGSLEILWDCGSTLSVLYGVDACRRID
jgi:hypothetical protein